MSCNVGSEFPNQTLMRTPTAGATAERFLETPGTTGFAFHCPTVAKSACALSRMDKDELIFYSLDPVKGQGAELARTKVGDPGDVMTWALSPDGKNIAVTGCHELKDKVRVIDLQTGKQRELPIPSFIFGGLSWSPDGSALYGAGRGVSSRFSVLRLDLSGKSQILLNRDDYPVSHQPRRLPRWALPCIRSKISAIECLQPRELLINLRSKAPTPKTNFVSGRLVETL